MRILIRKTIIGGFEVMPGWTGVRFGLKFRDKL